MTLCECGWGFLACIFSRCKGFYLIIAKGEDSEYLARLIILDKIPKYLLT